MFRIRIYFLSIEPTKSTKCTERYSKGSVAGFATSITMSCQRLVVQDTVERLQACVYINGSHFEDKL